MARTQAGTRTLVSRNSNILYNGGFEIKPGTITAATSTTNKWIDGTSGGSSAAKALGWRTNILAGTGSGGFDITIFNTGTASMKVSTLSTGSNMTVQVGPTGVTNAAILALTPASPSTAYTCTFYMKTTVNSGAATSGSFLSMRTLTATSSAVATINSTKINTTTGFTKYTITFTTGSTVAYLNPILTVTGNDGTATLIMDAWFDDIIIARNNLSRTTAGSRSPA